MKRTAPLLGGLVGVVVLVSVASPAASVRAEPEASVRRQVALRTPAAGKIAVAVVRFTGARALRPRLRLAARYARPRTAAVVVGTARVSGGRHVGLVAIVNFRAARGQPTARPILRVAATRGFVLDYAGDAEAYRGKLRALLRRIGRSAWRPTFTRVPPADVDPGYRTGRVLLDQVRRVLAGNADPRFLAAVRGTTVSPPPPPPAPPAPPPAPPPPGPVQLSSDPFTNPTSQHRTQVEPDSFAFGSTIVAAFQSGRFFDGGASGIGFATSTDNGATWKNGFLAGLTVYTGGGYDRATDPSVAFDARHNVWLIETLAMTGASGAAVVVSRSSDGISWSAPVVVGSGGDIDKNWIVCDNHPASAHYGNCYSEWDDIEDSDRIKMTTSHDGGLTWSSPANTADNASGVGGQPVVQPNGTVVVPIGNRDLSEILAFRSSDGGASWSAATVVSSVSAQPVAGGLRASPLPVAEVAGDGAVYVAWQDCRFRAACSANDIVISTNTQAAPDTWSAPIRVPIDAVTSGADHFIPGLAVDPSSGGATTRLALAYYYYPDAACTLSTCELDVGLIASADAGATWTGAARIAGPMAVSWLPQTSQGRMAGDYISTSFAGGVAYPFFALARPPTGATFDVAIYTRR